MDSNNLTPYDKLKRTYDEYLAILEQRLQKNPQDREALLHKAIVLYDFYKKPDEGEAIFQILLRQDPSNVDVYLWCGEFQRFFYGGPIEAAQYLKKALEIDPNRADCHALLAGMLEELKDTAPEEVEFHYRKSFELEPTYIHPRFYLAKYFFEQGKFKQARHELEEALKYITDGKWPTSNPVEEYYEEMITGRSSDGNTRILDFIKEIDEAEAAAKLGTKE